MSRTKQEQLGYAKVHWVCASMNAIWRPTVNVDLGVDGQIEFLEPDKVVSSGKIIAVQVKSGPSYFKRESSDCFLFNTSTRHRRYWGLINLPVLLVLHDDARALTIFTFVKQQLAHGARTLRLDKEDRFEPEARDEILAGYEEEMREIRRLIQPDYILDSFRRAKIRGRDNRRINGLHFLLSCVDPSGKYFELRYARLRAGFSVIDREAQVSGYEFNEFIQRCVVKCWGFELVESFENAFEQAWYELEVMPDIVVPLTGKGRYVIRELLSYSDESLEDATGIPSGLSSHGSLAQKIVSAAQTASDRQDKKDFPHEYLL
jgi:hypothetical protein